MSGSITASGARRRVAFVIDTIEFDTAGTQKQLLEVLRRLDRTSFDPELICLWQSPWMQHNPLPCPCTVLGYRGLLKLNLVQVLRRFAHRIDEGRLDLLVTYFEDSIFVTALARALSRRRPALLSSRRDIGLGTAGRPWYHSLYALAMPFVDRYYDGLIANSEEVRRHVARRERLPPERIQVIYNGVDVPASSPDASVPAVLQAHPGDAWIGIVASLTPVKRHDVLIRALGILAKQGRLARARLLVLGEGPERERLETLVAELGLRDRVHFEGAVKDVGSYLDGIDIGVLCSDREGLSNAILEYMAHGLPVVATRVGGNPELVRPDTGICVPPAAPEGLAEALGKLLEEPELRTCMSAQARARVDGEFSWAHSMTQLEQHLARVVAAG